MLLNMSSGIRGYSESYMGSFFFTTLVRDPHFQFQHQLLAAHGLSLERVFPVPGSQRNYSNTNTVLLGEIAEKVTGKPYARLLNQRLFRPVGMKRTFLDQRGGLRPPFTQTYGFFRKDSYVRTTQWSISWGWAAGGVASTLQDGHRWAVALGTGRGVLSPETQAMRTQHCAPAEVTPGSTEVTDYCLGVIVVRNLKAGEVIRYWHNGGLFGAEAWLGYFPQTGASLVILANGRDETNPHGLPDRVAERIETALPDLFRR